MNVVETKKIVFKESRALYLFLLFNTILTLISVSIFLYLIKVSIYGIIGNVLLFFYFYLIISKMYYKLFNNRIHILLILIAIFSIAEYIVSKEIAIFISLVFTIFIQIITSIPFASYTYTMSLEHQLLNGNHDLLIIKFNKIFFTANFKYKIPKNEDLRFVGEINPSLYKPAMFHKLILVDSDVQIEVAPLSANGFDVVNKIYEFMLPYPLIVTNIPRTNNRLTLPEMKKIGITIPKFGLFENHMSVGKLPNIVNSNDFRKVLPKNMKSYIISLLMSIAIFIIGFSLFSVIINNLMGKTEEISSGVMILIITTGTVLIISGFILLISLLTVVLGKLQIEVNNKIIIITYTFLFKQIKVPIHRAFNPQVRIKNNLLELIIYGDHMETIYLHKLGKLKNISEIINNLQSDN